MYDIPYSIENKIEKSEDRINYVMKQLHLQFFSLPFKKPAKSSSGS